jgi:hypothetical protein
MGLDVLKIRAFLESRDVPVKLLQPANQVATKLISTPRDMSGLEQNTNR